MSYTAQNVIDKANSLGGLDTSDATLQNTVTTTVEMVIVKVSAYISYDCTTVDALLPVLAEITVTQMAYYTNLQTPLATLPAIKTQRGDYTVEYSSDMQKFYMESFYLTSFQAILNKFKKLRSL